MVPQLGQQKKQSIPPLKVFSEHVQTGSWFPPTEEEVVDPDFEKQYGEAARAQGMTIRQYLNQLQGYADDELKHPFEIGKPLVRPNHVKDLPLKMRRVHQWYMKEAAKGGNWIYVHHKNEHFGHGDDCVMIEFAELYQLYQMDDLDKSILSTYCL